ncbi:MAG TPA: G5 domain-containing protein [Patescibacteria group bacterium]|nr:G5 domain-containing protein [Patescibacteria group bacterium]
MKFNLKFLFAGVAIIPMGIGAISFSSLNKPLPTTPSKGEEVALPYIVDEIAPDGQEVGQYSGTTTKTDQFEIATDIGAKPFPEDKFTAFPDIKMSIGSKITLYRSPSYTVIDGKKNLTLRSWTGTVGEFLTEQNIEIGADDKINFAVSTNLENEMKIVIVRVALTTIAEHKSIDFSVTKKNDNTLDKGKTKIQQKGVLGVRTLTYLVRREDGVEISRTLQKNEITTPPVTEIQIIGTKPVITGWCKYNDLVLDASIKNGLDPDKLCALMRLESNGHADSVGQGGAHLGLFQYDPGFWSSASAKAGYTGANIFDAKAQIYTTAWALTHGYSGRW